MEGDKNLAMILAEIKKLRADNKIDFEKVKLEAKADSEKIRLEVKTDFNAIAKKIELINTTIKESNSKMDKICKKINEHEVRIDKLEELPNIFDSMKFDNDMFFEQVTTKLTVKDNEIADLKTQLHYLEIDRRRNNIVISGITETPGEDKTKLANTVCKMFKELLGIEGKILPHQVYRRGENRRVILKLDDSNTKSTILKNSYKLKGSAVFISHDYTIKQETARYHLRQFIKNKGEGKAKFTSQFNVELEGVNYTYNDIKNLVEPKI